MRPPVAPSMENPWQVMLAEIVAIRDEIGDVRTYDLVIAEPRQRDAYRFAPGQFNMLYVPGVGEAAISISSSTASYPVLQHTVRRVGSVTGAIASMQVGDQLPVRGPFGSAWPIADCAGRDVVIAAGGIGLAPLRPVILEMANNRAGYGRVWILYGARTPSDLMYRAEYDQWRAAGIEVFTTVDRAEADWKGEIGVVTDLLRHVDATAPRLLTCGPEIMMRFVILNALNRGWAAEQITLSMERNMNCALGFCGHCQLGPEFICKSGPVYDYPRMEPYLRLEDL